MKENVTLSNTCFRYDGTAEADQNLKIINRLESRDPKYVGIPFNGISGAVYFIDTNRRCVMTFKQYQNSGMKLVSPSDYLQLLTSQPSRLTEEDLKEFNNEINKNEYWTMAGVDGVVFDSFINIEYKFFEGYNVPIRTDKNGTPLESFNKSYDRVSKFIEYRHKLISPSAQEEDLSQQAQEEGKIDSKIIIGDNENIKCIADQIKEVFDKYKDEESRIELSAKISYYYFKNGINQYRKWKTESDNKLSSLQQEVDKMRELLKESKRFCGGSLQARIDNLLN